MTEVEIEPLFASANAALSFAFRFSTEQYAPSPMGRLAAGAPIGSGKGLAGLDGAGQAGMILAEVKSLGMDAEQFLAAQFAPRSLPCSCRRACCTGFRPGPAWAFAIAYIAEMALVRLADRHPNLTLRRGLVSRFFGERVNMTELAKAARVSRDTAAEHFGKLLPWLKDASGLARHRAIAALKDAGITT